MSIPRQIYEFFLYKDLNGTVTVERAGESDRDLPTSDPGDTIKDGDENPDLSVGEGSSPAVIPPEYRNRMGTVISVNMTNSQNVSRIEFTQAKRTYALDTINTLDKRSIALGQGDWQVLVSYCNNGEETVLGPKNIIIVPSNDPQSIKEHYLYFYLNQKNEYSFVTGGPPTDNNETDIIPPDDGYGSGVIMITNNTNAMAISATVRNLDNDSVQNYYYDTGFIPKAPIQYKQTSYVNVVGTPDFVIEDHNRYLVSIDMEAINGIATIQRLVYLLNSVVHIEINDRDLNNPEEIIGVTMTLNNQHDEALITGLVLEDQNGRRLVYGINSWEHEAVAYGMSAIFQVL
jgi:hypothetical protein